MTEFARGPLGLSGTSLLRTALCDGLVTNRQKRAKKEDATPTRFVIAHVFQVRQHCIARFHFQLKLPWCKPNGNVTVLGLRMSCFPWTAYHWRWTLQCVCAAYLLVLASSYASVFIYFSLFTTVILDWFFKSIQSSWFSGTCASVFSVFVVCQCVSRGGGGGGGGVIVGFTPVILTELILN